MTQNYNFWSFCQDVTAAVFAVPTYGASLTISPTARGLAEKIIGGNDQESSANKALDQWKVQNEQWKLQMEANREETKRLREEREANEKKAKANNDEVDRLRSIITNPHSSDEEKKNAKKRIVLLETEVKNLKERNKKLDSDITNKSKTPPAPSRPWLSYLPNLGFTDKVIMAGGITLITYLLISKEEKKK